MPVLVDHDVMLAFTRDVFQAAGALEPEAQAVAEHLVTASAMGYDTHGVMRIPQYVEDLRKGTIKPGGSLNIERHTGATLLIDCGWNFGQVGGNFAIDAAIQHARQFQIAMAVARRCNHAGRLGAYTTRAAKQGFLAMAFCNSPIHGHFVSPWGGREGRLATNPISFAMPRGGENPVVADFSTAEASEGAIRLHRNKGLELPAGWITDGTGAPSTDPEDFYGPPRGAIRPFGGNRGYRGFALAMLVEVIGGLLGGSPVLKTQPGNGLGFIVIDPSAFVAAAEFRSMMDEMCGYIKSSETAAGFDEVFLPGELDFRTQRARMRDGIPVDENTWGQIAQAAESVGMREIPGERAAV